MKNYKRVEVLPGWYQWIDEATGKPVKLKPHEERERRSGDGSVPPVSAQAPQAGYKVESNNYPCPEPGAEGGTVYTKYNGRPAIWENGVLYVKE